MKILLINFEYPPLGGGGGVATAQIAKELAARHEVHVLTTAFHNLPSEEILHGVHIHRIQVWGRKELPTATIISLLTFAPAALWNGIALMRQYKFDIIHAQFVIPSGLPAALLAMVFRVPFVLTFVGGDVYDPSKALSPHRIAILRALIRWIASRADARTAISHDTKTRTIELHGVQEDIKVVPIGLVHRTQTNTSKIQNGIPEDSLLCVSIGRLVPRKGYDVLLQAWKNIPNAHLVIMGDGPLKVELTNMITSFGLVDRVLLAGHVTEEQKQKYLSCADLYVSAAQHEGFGIVFLEAMDAGLPIVAANDGGQRDFLHHGEHALLVAPHDHPAITRAIDELMSDAYLRDRMGKKNKEDVQQYYIENTAKQFEKVLADAIQGYEHRN